MDSDRDKLPPTINENLFRLSFDPIEANFLATVLQDCYYQLFNVGKAFEPKHLKLPALIEAEEKGRSEEKLLKKQGIGGKVNNVHTLLDNANEDGDDEFTILDESSRWVEKLVEASGFLENLYMDVLEKAQDAFDARTGHLEGPTLNLEKEGIRMKTFELSKIIADRENLLNQAASDRVDCILNDLRKTIFSTSQELRDHGTYETLKKRNQVQLEDFAKTSETVKKEIFYFNECQKLLDYILQERNQGLGLTKARENQIAVLKDYLKEQKVLKTLEINYVKKFSEAELDQAKKRNDKEIELIKEKETRVKMEVKNDKLCNQVMETHLKQQIEKMEKELKQWTAKYEAILDSKMQELRTLQIKQAKDTELHSTLKKRIVEYEQVIADEARMQKISDDAEKLLQLQQKNAIRIQAWWKGMIVRKCVGAFKKKKSKGKKGKGKGKGKKG